MNIHKFELHEYVWATIIYEYSLMWMAWICMSDSSDMNIHYWEQKCVSIALQLMNMNENSWKLMNEI